MGAALSLSLLVPNVTEGHRTNWYWSVREAEERGIRNAFSFEVVAECYRRRPYYRGKAKHFRCYADDPDGAVRRTGTLHVTGKYRSVYNYRIE